MLYTKVLPVGKLASINIQTCQQTRFDVVFRKMMADSPCKDIPTCSSSTISENAVPLCCFTHNHPLHEEWSQLPLSAWYSAESFVPLLGRAVQCNCCQKVGADLMELGLAGVVVTHGLKGVVQYQAGQSFQQFQHY